jgi:hypothetical protein
MNQQGTSAQPGLRALLAWYGKLDQGFPDSVVDGLQTIELACEGICKLGCDDGKVGHYVSMMRKSRSRSNPGALGVLKELVAIRNRRAHSSSTSDTLRWPVHPGPAFVRMVSDSLFNIVVAILESEPIRDIVNSAIWIEPSKIDEAGLARVLTTRYQLGPKLALQLVRKLGARSLDQESLFFLPRGGIESQHRTEAPALLVCADVLSKRSDAALRALCARIALETFVNRGCYQMEIVGEMLQQLQQEVQPLGGTLSWDNQRDGFATKAREALNNSMSDVITAAQQALILEEAAPGGSTEGQNSPMVRRLLETSSSWQGQLLNLALELVQTSPKDLKQFSAELGLQEVGQSVLAKVLRKHGEAVQFVKPDGHPNGPEVIFPVVTVAGRPSNPHEILNEWITGLESRKRSELREQMGLALTIAHLLHQKENIYGAMPERLQRLTESESQPQAATSRAATAGGVAAIHYQRPDSTRAERNRPDASLIQLVLQRGDQQILIEGSTVGEFLAAGLYQAADLGVLLPEERKFEAGWSRVLFHEQPTHGNNKPFVLPAKVVLDANGKAKSPRVLYFDRQWTRERARELMLNFFVAKGWVEIPDPVMGESTEADSSEEPTDAFAPSLASAAGVGSAEALDTEPGTHVLLLEFPDGRAKQVSAGSVKQLMMQTLRVMDEEGLLSETVQSFATGYKRYLVNSQPNHIDKAPFTHPGMFESRTKLTFYFEANTSPAQARTYLLRYFNHCLNMRAAAPDVQQAARKGKRTSSSGRPD